MFVWSPDEHDNLSTTIYVCLCAHMSIFNLNTEDFQWLQWLLDHPNFSRNPLYIAGDSYAGIFVPMVVMEIAKGDLC